MHPYSQLTALAWQIWRHLKRVHVQCALPPRLPDCYIPTCAWKQNSKCLATLATLWLPEITYWITSNVSVIANNFTSFGRALPVISQPRTLYVSVWVCGMMNTVHCTCTIRTFYDQPGAYEHHLPWWFISFWVSSPQFFHWALRSGHQSIHDDRKALISNGVFREAVQKRCGYSYHWSYKVLFGSPNLVCSIAYSSDVAKAGPGWACARPKFVPLMSRNLVWSVHEC